MAATARSKTRPPEKQEEGGREEQIFVAEAEEEESEPEESESEDEEVSEGAEEQQTPQTQSSPIPKLKNVHKSQSSSESESEETQPLPSKATPLPPKAPQRLPKSSSKKKKKIKPGKEECATPKTQVKKSGANKLWSEADQIALLQGKIDYKTQKEAGALANVTSYYDFVKDKLNVEVSKAQVDEKLRRLKQRFSANRDVPSTSNPLDLKIFELSNEIWGSKSSSLVVSNAVDPPKKKEKKRNARKDEENGEKKKKKQKTASKGKDEQTASKGKDNRAVAEGKDDQTVAERKGIRATTDEGKNDQTVGKGNGKQIVIHGVAQVEVEKGEDFWSKYPHFLNSFSAKYYPLTPEETLRKWKEKATLLDCSVAEKVEKKWANVWEDCAKLGGMVADLVSLQARLVCGEEVTL